MATLADLRFWTHRQRELAAKVAACIDRGESPPPETVTALHEVGGLLEELVLRTPVTAEA